MRTRRSRSIGIRPGTWLKLRNSWGTTPAGLYRCKSINRNRVFLEIGPNVESLPKSALCFCQTVKQPRQKQKDLELERFVRRQEALERKDENNPIELLDALGESRSSF